MDFKEDIQSFRENHKPMNKKIGIATFKYWLSGKGEYTYVLLPGGMGSGEFFFKQILLLEKYAKVLTLDYPVELEDNNSMADGIVALIDNLKLKKVIYVGQSYGGMIAQVIAKRHTKKIFGLVLSNTGTATSEVIQRDNGLKKMIERLKMGQETLKTMPYDEFQKYMLIKMGSYLDAVEEKYRHYINDTFKYMVKVLSRERNILMTKLLLDFYENQRFTKDDFINLEDRVMLIFAPDDKTFSEAVRDELIALLPNPTINHSLKGGHLAILIEIDKFILSLVDFQKSIKKTV